MNSKQGTRKKGAGESMSKWSIPSPSGYKPETAPAKPQGGKGAGALANKHANTMGHSATSSNAAAVVSSIKRRY